MYSMKNLPQHYDKTQKTWTGPYQNTGIEDHKVYEIRNVKENKKMIHAGRMYFYNDKKFILEQCLSQGC